MNDSKSTHRCHCQEGDQTELETLRRDRSDLMDALRELLFWSESILAYAPDQWRMSSNSRPVRHAEELIARLKQPNDKVSHTAPTTT